MKFGREKIMTVNLDWENLGLLIYETTLSLFSLLSPSGKKEH